MRWTSGAEEAIGKVPFFARRRVRKKVEHEAERQNASEVTLEHVRTCQQNFLKNMEDEIKGYQFERCFGTSGCPNRIPIEDNLTSTLQNMLRSRNLKTFLKSKVNGPLKFHHEFRVSVSDCPNACSRPQITDLGIIAAINPAFSNAKCSRCGACAETCIENAITVTEEMSRPGMSSEKCISCGQCIRACPTGTLVRGQEGYRIMAGGKLARHPRLASEIPGVFSKERTLQIIVYILDLYIKHNTKDERLGEILERVGFRELQQLAK